MNKKALIVTLLCINVALLLTLLVGYGAKPAKAQVIEGADYLMVMAREQQGTEMAFIIDLAKFRMIAVRYDRTTKTVFAVPRFGRELLRDFKHNPS